jgi:hypothetical protein
MKRYLQVGAISLSFALLVSLPGCLFGRKTIIPKPAKQQEEQGRRNAEKLRLKGENTLKEAETGEGFPHF